MRHLFVAATLAATLPFAGLPSQFEKIAPAAKGPVGVAAQLLESGETASLHGDEHFPMHSVYKLPISMAVLQRVDRGELKLDQHVKVEPSDFARKGMSCPLGPWSHTRPAPAALKTASPPRLTTSALSLCPMVDTSPWPHSSPIPPPMITREMRSSPAWPKPPGIALNR